MLNLLLALVERAGKLFGGDFKPTFWLGFDCGIPFFAGGHPFFDPIEDHGPGWWPEMVVFHDGSDEARLLDLLRVGLEGGRDQAWQRSQSLGYWRWLQSQLLTLEFEFSPCPLRLDEPEGQDYLGFLCLAEELESHFLCISATEKVEAKILGRDHVPKAGGSEQVVGIHFVVQACLIALYSLQVIYDLDKALKVVLFFLPTRLVSFLALRPFPLEILIFLIIWIAILGGEFQPVFNSQGRSAGPAGALTFHFLPGLRRRRLRLPIGLLPRLVDQPINNGWIGWLLIHR